MTFMNPLPPQAYTKETLVQAYAWLQTQNQGIKEIATSPDVLVSLYLKAKLQGDGALERPSIQNFKNELRNLAGLMGEFEVEPTEPSPPRHPTATATAHQTIRFRSQDLKAEKILERQALEKGLDSGIPANPNAHSTSSVSFSASFSQSSSAPSEKLDTRSREMIQEVKNHFNLSSDTEAMRLLISVGYNHIKNTLK